MPGASEAQYEISGSGGPFYRPIQDAQIRPGNVSRNKISKGPFFSDDTEARMISLPYLSDMHGYLSS